MPTKDEESTTTEKMIGEEEQKTPIIVKPVEELAPSDDAILEEISERKNDENGDRSEETSKLETPVAFVDEGETMGNGVQNGKEEIVNEITKNDQNHESTKVENISVNAIDDRKPLLIKPIEDEKLEEKQTAASGFGDIKTISPTSSATGAVKSKPLELTYQVKWIQWSAGGGSSMTPIVTQNGNGPCPLLALVNVLFLRGQAKLEPDVRSVSSQFLLDILRDRISRMTPQDSAHQADYQRNVADALASLPKLAEGLDVNVRFTRIDQFEYTPACLIFDLLNIPLYHGWLVEPERGPLADAIGQLSYNQLIEFIIKSRSDEQMAINAFLAKDFLDMTASQLTYRGLCELISNLKDGALCVFFRNNHFSTLLKHEDELFILVTDQGFLNEPHVVWESLDSVDGDSRFVDMEFRTVPPKSTPLPSDVLAPLPADASPQEQVDHDLMVALSLEEQDRAAADIDDGEVADVASGTSSTLEERDRRLALKLQEEEDKLAAQEHEQQRQGSPSGSGGAAASTSQQRNSPESSTAGATRSSGGKKDKVNIEMPEIVRGIRGRAHIGRGSPFTLLRPGEAGHKFSFNVRNLEQLRACGHGRSIYTSRPRNF